MSGTPLPVRQVICASLCLYSAGIFVLAIYPTSDITAVEWIVAVLSVVAVLGLVAHAVPAIRVPGERYAYLVSGLVGITTLLLYLLTPTHGDPVYDRVRVTLLLLAGVVGSYGAYWEQQDADR